MSSDFVTPKFQVRQPGGLVLQKMAELFSASLVLWLLHVCFDIYNSLFYVISIFLLLVLFFYLFFVFYADLLFSFIHYSSVSFLFGFGCVVSYLPGRIKPN